MSVTDVALTGLPQRIGRYRVRSIVGVGGFAVVLRAEDDALQVAVAIKVLGSSQAVDPETRERFVHEARLLRRVRSPSVIAIHDIGEMEDGRPYFVMELAETSLGQRLLPNQIVDVASVRQVVLALYSGLDALHRAGIVHRDVKPDNLLVLSDRTQLHSTTQVDASPQRTIISKQLLQVGERVVIGDLGLAKDQRRSDQGHTVLGGSAHYQAPEQTELGAEITAATDVYGATAVLWRMLSGDTPPDVEHIPMQLIGLPAEWRLALGRGLERDPVDRFPSIEAWRDEMIAVLGDTGQPAAMFTPRTSNATPIDGSTCPYKGLASFQPEDATLFFGRRVLVDELVARLMRSPVLVIAGPSGSGKSSVLRAGLLAALEHGALPGSQRWHQILVTPGRQPMRNLHSHLVEHLRIAVSVDELRRDPSQLEAVAAQAEPIVIAIDQLEELFTLCEDPTELDAFLKVLSSLTTGAHTRVKVVVAIRADFYAQAAGYPWLADRVNENQVLVGQMRRDELRDAIEGPATRVGLRVEDGLAERIIDDAGTSPGALPLVAHALMETWARRRGNLLTLNGYEVAGGVAGAIAQTADHVAAFSPVLRPTARAVLLSLVSVDGRHGATRRRVPRDELGASAATKSVVDALVDARLVTVDGDSVEVAHEALITTWPRLHHWVDETRADLITRDRIALGAVEWDRQGRSPDLLLRGTPLATGREWATKQVEIPAMQQSFLDESQRVQTDAQVRIEKTRRRTIRILSSLTIFAVLATVIALVGLRQARHNENVASASRVLAEERFALALAGSAEQLATSDPALAVRLAAEAMSRTQPPTVAARKSLIASRVELSRAALRPEGGQIRVGASLTVAVAPDGKYVIAGGFGGVLGVWDVATHVQVAQLLGPTGGIQKAKFAPTGGWAVGVDDHGDLWRWNLTGLDPGSSAPETAIDREQGDATGAQGVKGARQRRDVKGTRLLHLNTIVWGVAIAPVRNRDLQQVRCEGHLQARNPETCGSPRTPPPAG